MFFSFGEFSCIMYLIVSSSYHLPPGPTLLLCSTFQDSSSTLSSNFPTEFFVSASCVFLNSQERLLFFKPSSLRHSVLILWMP